MLYTFALPETESNADVTLREVQPSDLVAFFSHPADPCLSVKITHAALRYRDSKRIGVHWALSATGDLERASDFC